MFSHSVAVNGVASISEQLDASLLRSKWVGEQ
jgi:hypothetical protein